MCVFVWLCGHILVWNYHCENTLALWGPAVCRYERRCVHSIWTMKGCVCMYVQFVSIHAGCTKCTYQCVCVLRCRWMLILLEVTVRQNKAQLRCPRGHVELVLIAWWKSLCVIGTVTNIQFALSQGAQVGHSTDTGQSQDMLLLLRASTQLVMTAAGAGALHLTLTFNLTVGKKGEFP